MKTRFILGSALAAVLLMWGGTGKVMAQKNIDKMAAELEKRDDIRPVTAPEAHDCFVFVTPFGVEGFQFVFGFFSSAGLVNALEGGDHTFGILGGDIAQAGTNHVYHAQLGQCLGEDGIDRFRQTV